MKYCLVVQLLMVLIVGSAKADKDIFQLLEVTESLSGSAAIRFKCMNDVVITIHCNDLRNKCGEDLVPVESAMERACNKVVPPTPPARGAKKN